MLNKHMMHLSHIAYTIFLHLKQKYKDDTKEVFEGKVTKYFESVGSGHSWKYLVSIHSARTLCEEYPRLYLVTENSAPWMHDNCAMLRQHIEQSADEILFWSTFG